MRVLSRVGRRGARAGYTMVELAVALTIVVIASVGGFASQHASRSLMRTSHETLLASSELQNAMNQLLLVNVDQLADADGPFPDGVPIAAFAGRALSNESIVPTYPGLVAGSVPDLLDIRLTISWQTYRGRTRTLTFSTSKAR